MSAGAGMAVREARRLAGLADVSGTPVDRAELVYNSASGKYEPRVRRTLVTLGDSLDDPVRPSAGQGWRPQLTAADPYFRGATPHDGGISGQTSTQILARYATDAHPYAPANADDEAWLFEDSGVNDFAGGATVNDVLANRRSIWSQGRADKFTVVAQGLPPYGNNVALNAAVAGYPDEWHYFERADLWFPNPADTDLYVDGTHLTALGQQYRAANIAYMRRAFFNPPPGTYNCPGLIVARGRVGIGTSAPAYDFDVTGAGRFTGALTAASLATGAGAISGGAVSGTTGTYSSYVAATGGFFTVSGNTNPAAINQDGRATFNSGALANFGQAYVDAAVQISPNYANAPALLLQGYPGQAVDIFRVNDAAGNRAAGVGNAGYMFTRGASGGYVFEDRTGANSFTWYATGGIARLNNNLGGDLMTVGQSGNFTFTGNLGLNGSSYGGGTGVEFSANATLIPSTSPSGGGIAYTVAGERWWKGSDGKVGQLSSQVTANRCGWDADGDPLTAPRSLDFEIPYPGTIVGWGLTGDSATGTATLDVLKTTYTGFPGSLASIVASAPPTLAGAYKNEDATLTGWTTAVAAGDRVRVTLSAVGGSVTRLSFDLRIKRAA